MSAPDFPREAPVAQSTWMTKADFVTSLCLIALGIGAAVESYRMPRLEELNVDPYTVPGIVPGLLGSVIAALGMVLLLRSVHRGGWRFDRPGVRHFFTGPAARRLLLVAGLTLAYAAGLVGRIPFWLATGLFVFAFIILFEWPAASQTGRLPRTIAVALVQSVLTTVAVTAVFQYVFLVRLP